MSRSRPLFSRFRAACRSLWRRLTSRMACFVWGALFGNAVLMQPVDPLNLLLQPPEYMLNADAQHWLAQARFRVLEWKSEAWQWLHAQRPGAPAERTAP